MQTRSRKASFAGAVVAAIILIALVFIALNWTRFVTVTGSIEAGGNKTYEIEAYSSRIVATLTSTNGNINVRIVLDGQTISTQSGHPYFDFNERIDFGLHTVQMVVENPAVPGADAHILIAGQLSCNLL